MDPSQLAELKQLILKKVSIYYNKLGIIVDISELNKHININKIELDTIINKKPIKHTKPKIKFNLNKKNDYDKFVDICKLNNLNYFKYYDEHKWEGPAIKCINSSLNVYKTYFNKIEIILLEGTMFYIIHPKNSFTDTINYNYPNIKFNKIGNRESLIPYNSDGDNSNSDSNSDIEESDPSDDESVSDSEIETEEWDFKNTRYLIDYKNNVYSYHTNEFVGVKIDEYTIDFDSDEL